MNIRCNASLLMCAVLLCVGCASLVYDNPQGVDRTVAGSISQAIALDNDVQNLVQTLNRYPNDLEVAQTLLIKAKGIQSATNYNSVEEFNRKYAKAAAVKINSIKRVKIPPTKLKTLNDVSFKLYIQSLNALTPHLKMDNELALYEGAVMLLIMYDELSDTYAKALKEPDYGLDSRKTALNFLQRSAGRGYQPARKLLIALGEPVPPVSTASLYDKIAELQKGQEVLMQTAKARIDYELTSANQGTSRTVVHLFMPEGVSNQSTRMSCRSSCSSSPLGLSIDCNSYCN